MIGAGLSASSFSIAGAESARNASGGGSGMSAADALGAGTALLDGIFSLSAGLAQAKALKSDARQRELEGIAESNDRAREGRAAQGAGAAIAGASGFTLEHSATDVLARMAQESETSAARARWEASRDAAQARYEAKVRKRQAIFGFFGSILKAATFAAGG